MRILVTFAVEAEFAPWRRLRNLEPVEFASAHVFRAQIGRAQVDFVITGMGADNARQTCERLVSEPYQFCLTTGFAGALNDKHSVGDVLVAESVQLLGKSKTLQCSRNLVHAARSDGAKLVKLFLTSDHVVRTVEEKSQLAPFADAVEMESFGVLSAAAQRKLPAAAIRVISDDVRKDMPAIVETGVDEYGRIKIGGVLKYVATNPLQVPALVRLGRDSRTASDALAHFLEAFIKKLSFSVHGWPPPDLQEVAAR